MAILTFEQKPDFWKRPLICPPKIYSAQNMSRHDLGKALLFFPSKIYSALYVHPDFRISFSTPLKFLNLTEKAQPFPKKI